MLTNRQKLILGYLNTEDFTTASFIARRMELSDRTIRSELKLIAEYLPECGMELVSKPKYGYRLIVIDPVLAENSTLASDDLLITSEQRVRFILEYLFAYDNYVKVEDLCSLLHLSQSSISQDLKMTRELLEQYDLRLVVRPHYGMRIEGSEINLRHCMSSCLTRFEKDGKKDLLDKEKMQLIYQILENLFEENHFHMTDFAFDNLVMHILIAVQRIQEGNRVQMTEEKLQELKANPCYSLAEQIADKVGQRFHVDIPQSECGYITIHLLGKQMLKTGEEENLVISEQIYELVDAMLRSVDEEMNLDLGSDLNIRLGLALHLVPLENRLKNNLNMRNPLLKEIKMHYMLAFMIATTACSVLRDYYQCEISEDEIGYIALYMHLALERKRETIQKKNIVIVCSTGRGTAELLGYQYRDKFGKYINKLVACDVLDLGRVDFTDIDFVISTVYIPKKLPVPIVRVQYFLESRDEDTVKKMLNRTGGASIERFFDPDLFLVNVPARSRTEVIDYISARIRNFYKVPRNFKELILLREKKAVTEFGNLVALPHPYRVCTTQTIISVVILKHPIIWDKKKVQLVFFISLAKGKNPDIQKFYTIISKFLTSRTYVKLLLHEKKYSTLMNILREIEAGMEQ